MPWIGAAASGYSNRGSDRDVPQRDIYHDAVKNALAKDGWTITHDPLMLSIGLQDMYVDLGASRVLAAERGEERIAVEVKSFVGRSAVADLQQAMGQYLLYRTVLARQEPERALYLAVPTEAYEGIFSSALGRVALEDYQIRLIVCDPDGEVIERWLT